jgi:hypothetical protein
MTMKVLFYYYYLFYNKLFPEADPQLTAILVLSFSESTVIIIGYNLIFGYLFCSILTKYYMMGITLMIVLVNSLFYLTPKNIKDIIKAKPSFYGNHKLTVALVGFFFILTISSIFWRSDLSDFILENCQKK